jgi:hypothetical protein
MPSQVSDNGEFIVHIDPPSANASSVLPVMRKKPSCTEGGSRVTIQYVDAPVAAVPHCMR